MLAYVVIKGFAATESGSVLRSAAEAPWRIALARSRAACGTLRRNLRTGGTRIPTLQGKLSQNSLHSNEINHNDRTLSILVLVATEEHVEVP